MSASLFVSRIGKLPKYPDLEIQQSLEVPEFVILEQEQDGPIQSEILKFWKSEFLFVEESLENSTIDPTVDKSLVVYSNDRSRSLYRIYNTAVTWLSQKRNMEYKECAFPQAWEMFHSAIVHHFMNYLNADKKFRFIDKFLLITPEINLCSLKNVVSNFDAELQLPLTQPICIPIVLYGKETFSRNHIIGIMIKDGIIEYFDPIGTPSNQIGLADPSETLKDVLDHLEAKLGFKVIENEIKLQNDIHNCGAFVCDFFRRRLEDKWVMGSKIVALKSNDLLSIRDNIFYNIQPKMKTELEANMEPVTGPSLIQDFDDEFEHLMARE